MAIVILVLVFFECVMIIRYGVAPSNKDLPQFQYQYIDIYKDFFKKERRKEGIFYVPQRAFNNSEEFLMDKPLNELRIFIIGGSVGHNFGGNPFFKNELKRILPDGDIKVVPCAMGAYDSYRAYLVEKEILAYNPDLIIVFSGNNEFYNVVKVDVLKYRLDKIFKKSWVYQKLQEQFLKFTGESGSQYRSRKQRLVDYEKNLHLITQAAKNKKIPVILCTLPVNFADCAPFGIRPVDKEYLLAHYLFDQKGYKGAIGAINSFLDNNPENTFGLYLLANCYRQLAEYDKARVCYHKALDLSFGSGRASIESNKIVRSVCDEESVLLADIEKEFISQASEGLLGREQFSDNCHWYRECNYLAVKVIIQTFLKSKVANISDEQADFSIVVSDFPSLEKRGTRSDEIEGAIKRAAFESLRLPGGILERAVEYFETVYLMNPDALWNIQNIRERTENNLLNDDWLGGYLVDFNWSLVFYYIGETYRRLGMYPESLEYFNKSINLDEDPQDYRLYIGKALVYDALGDSQNAWKNIHEAENISEKQEILYYKDIICLPDLKDEE